jgi:hypothetical protein
MRTALEQLDRMNALVERIAAFDALSRTRAKEMRDEARAIMDERLDEDDRIAKQICDRSGIWSTAVQEAVKAGIMYGRAQGQFEAQQPAATHEGDLQAARKLCGRVARAVMPAGHENMRDDIIKLFECGEYDEGPSMTAVLEALQAARAGK